jgi:hypothetical protein
MEDRQRDRRIGASGKQPEASRAHNPGTESSARRNQPEPSSSAGANPSGASASQSRTLNLPALQSRLSQIRPSKAMSVGTSSTTSTVPVLVRSYAAPRAPRQTRRRDPVSTITAARTKSTRAQALEPLPSLPPVSEFAFSHVLLTVESEIQDPIEAISSICARSRYSLADEYGAHLPPQGEIRGGSSSSSYSSNLGRHGLFIRTTALADSALSVVQEASSSSAASDSGTMRSAYGSLRNVLSRKDTELTSRSDDGSAGYTQGRYRYSWIVGHNGNQSIVLAKDIRPLRQVVKESSKPAHQMISSESPTRNNSSRGAFGLAWLWGSDRNATSQPANAADRLKELLQVEILEYG